MGIAAVLLTLHSSLGDFPDLVLAFFHFSEPSSKREGLESSSKRDREGNGTPLQYSCLENPIDRGALVGCSPWGRKESDMTERLHFHFSVLCIGEGNGNPFQCSCLENPRDGVA